MNYIIIRDDAYLEHHGILGQKWGIRRYQNKDGTWTNAGKKRYGDDIPDGKAKKRGPQLRDPRRAQDLSDEELNKAVNRMRLEDQYNDLSGTRDRYANQKQNVVNSAVNAARGIANASGNKTAKDIVQLTDKSVKGTRAVKKAGKTYTVNDLKQYSDADLQKMVNRLNMEAQYNNLNERDIRRGYEKTAAIISAFTAGAAVAIGGYNFYQNNIKKG